MIYFFGLLPLSCDTPNRLDKLEDKGVFGLTCLVFLASLLLRFWPFAIVFASRLNGAGRQSFGHGRAVRQCDSRSQCPAIGRAIAAPDATSAPVETAR